MKKKFIVSFFLSAIFIVVFGGSVYFVYQAIMGHFGVDMNEENKTINIITPSVKEEETALSKSGVIPDKLESSLTDYVFLLNKKGKIEQILITVLDCNSNKLLVLTVPMDVKIDLSAGKYHKLTAEYPTIPQMMKISLLTDYFNKQNVYEYGRDMLNDELSLTIQNITVLDKEYADQIYRKNDDGIVIWTNEMKKWAELRITTKKTKEKLETYTNSAIKAREYKQMLPYLEVIEKIDSAHVIFQQIDGTQNNEEFIPDIIKIKQTIDALEGL